jgi:hypothetical protein
MPERKVKITASGVSAIAKLKDTPTAEKIWAALPLKGSANTWGDEIYFSIPVKAVAEPEATDAVSLGDIAYWPPGSAFCLFFGLTPASSGGVIRAASPVNVFGAIEGDPQVFKKVRARDGVSVEKA